MIKTFLTVAAGIALMASSGAAVAGDQNTTAQAQELANRIRSTIAALPNSSNIAAYQAQINSTIESENATCEIVRQALAMSYGSAPGEAQKAIERLRSTFAHCNFGTGAVGRSGGAYGPWGVGFSVGGGSSNYRP